MKARMVLLLAIVFLVLPGITEAKKRQARCRNIVDFIREEPEQDSKALVLVKQNQKVQILEVLGEWTKVKRKGVSGYMLTADLSLGKVDWRTAKPKQKMKGRDVARLALGSFLVGMESANRQSGYYRDGSGRCNLGGIELLLFGGRNHDVFLGCLNCLDSNSTSIENEVGPHGNHYSRVSIRNPHSPFGSHFSQYSACNPFAQNPPVVVTRNGAYCGRLTVNAEHQQIGVGRSWVTVLESRLCRQ